MDYTYYLRAEAAAPEVERRIAESTNDASWRRDVTHPIEPITVVPAITGARRMIARSYGFEPDVLVSVQVDKFTDDRRDREAQALDVLLALLEQYTGDLYADYYDGNPVLVRRDRVITVHRNWLEHRPWIADVLPPMIEVKELVPL